MLGDPTRGVARTTDMGGLPTSMLDAIADAGGLWFAGDYYAKPDAIVRTAREHGVRALRADARDLSWLGELPELEYLHLRTDGRPPLDPIQSLGHLRGLTVEVGAVRGTLDLEAHPHLRWLKFELSGKGGAANLPGILGGHPGVTHLRLSEVPFVDLTDLAAAFPAVQFLALHGADRLRKLGDLRPWASTLGGLGFTFALRLRTLDGMESLERIEYVGLTYGTFAGLDILGGVDSLRYLQLVATYPSLTPFAGHEGLRMARTAMPKDEDLGPLRTLPSLVALGGEQWIGRPLEGVVPCLEDLPRDHPLQREWQRAVTG